MGEVCRVCLADAGEFQTIFTSIKLGESRSTIHLSEMICSFAAVQITLGDGLPEQICTSCAEETVHMYFFKRRCEESDKDLRKKLSETLQIQNSTIEEINVKTELKTDLEQHLQEKNAFLCDFDKEFSNIDNDSLSDDNDQSVDLYEENSKVEKPQKVKQFECNICHKRFTREDLLLRHKIAHAMKMQDFVDKKEDSESEDEEPKKTESGIVEIDGTFAMDEILNKQDGSNLSSSECVLCNCTLPNGDSLEEHLTKHLQQIKEETGDYLLCRLCGHEIENIYEFKKHIKKKHQEAKSQKYSCPYCVVEYTKKGHLINHLKEHETADKKQDTKMKEVDNGQYICDHCEKIFKSRRDIRRHLNRVRGLVKTKRNPQSRKPHICEICFKAFNQISNLKDHLRTHNGEKPFLCPTCGKGFNQLGNLRQHQVRHSGVKSHICTTCGHGFASKGELHAHLRKHTGARPFVCDVCGNGFTTSSSLTKHKRIHSGEKPYECDYCKMKFSRSGILSRHRRIHTGEKPYVCQICRKGFTQSNDLNSHLRIHTGEKPFKCDECGQHFRQSSALRTHKKTHLEPKSQGRQLTQKKDKVVVFVEDEENILVKFEDLAVPVV